MTRVFLAAGVAALAIAAPANADKGDRGGNKGGQAAAQQGGGQQRAQRAERPQRAERQAQKQAAPRVERQQQRAERRAPRVERQQQRAERRAPRLERQQQRAERQVQPRFERRQERAQAQRAERQQRYAAFRQDRAKDDRKAERRVERANRVDRQQVRVERQQRVAKSIDRQQVRDQRVATRIDRQEIRDRRFANRNDRVELRNDRIDLRNDRVRIANAKTVLGFGAGACPPGLVSKGCVPPGQAYNANRFIGDVDAFRTSRFATLAYSPQTRIIDPYRAATFLGSPLSAIANSYSLMAMPSSVSYLYPDTDDYYYRYGGGYAYRVDRDNDLISYVLPLLAGGFMPGQYLPSSYMNSHMPTQYGFNSFYPDSQYDCNRYANGVIYEVDCMSGVVEDVIPLYAGGYGVGQYLPSSYGYYNVPDQYRDMYYNTSDQNYWYAPGAIYQVDPTSQLITAVASLLAPGFSVGQQLPTGYGMYNVPMAYRDTYYDTSSSWYRYNNGHIYQVDPTTQLVTAIVASILT